MIRPPLARGMAAGGRLVGFGIGGSYGEHISNHPWWIGCMWNVMVTFGCLSGGGELTFEDWDNI